MRKTPVCPKCKKELGVVLAIGATTWILEDEHYCAMKIDDDVTYKCPNCSQTLNHIFPEGIYYHGIN